jgi:hypothetical protein
MNNIGFGIFCFGDDFYYKGTRDKINYILDEGYTCYVLTENTNEFTHKWSPHQINLIEYKRSFKSYHDKLILVKHVLKNHDICILIDADTHIKDFSFLYEFKKYDFKEGISYIDTLLNHPAKREFVKDIVLDTPEWNSYKLYAETILPSYGGLETIWEYFLVINKSGFNQDSFFENYEKLQIAKEFSELRMNKQVSGAGEGISIAISSKLSNTNIQKDLYLYELLKDKMISVSRRHTPRDLWPKWML